MITARMIRISQNFGRTIDKLRKINAALMKRVERSMDQQANAFSLFQTAISQEAQIRLRTDQLNHALSKLAHTNVELGEARDAAERANRFKTRFFTAAGHDLLQPLHAARLNSFRADGRARRARQPAAGAEHLECVDDYRRAADEHSRHFEA